MPARIVYVGSDWYPLDDEDRASIAAAGAELVEIPEEDEDALAAAAPDADAVLIVSTPVSRETIAKLGRCQVIAICGTGWDPVDVEAARERGIQLVYSPDYATDEVSDHAVALMLACARKLVLSDRMVREGRWPSYEGLSPMYSLRGRVAGIVGYGRMGRRTAAKVRGFGLRPIAHDPFTPSKVFVDDVENVELDELLGASDFVLLHVPLTASTHHLIGARELAMMKPTATVVNTSRGAVIDAAALVDALSAGRIAGAGLDVFETEPLPLDDRLRSFANVILTPHSASYTEEARATERKGPLADVLRVMAGQPPLTPVPV
ncbi:MAG: C-terminal binding protein [Solirubrobacteraceae bacterium]